MKRIVVINVSRYVSGAEKSLNDFLIGASSNFKISLITGNTKFYNYTGPELFVLFHRFKLITWFHNFHKTLKFIISTESKIIYFNTEKSFITFFPIVIFSFKRKIVWHIRDNVKRKLVAKILAFFSYKIICNSRFILDQLDNTKKGVVVYNGIDTSQFNQTNNSVRKKKIIACVSQLTQWKKIEDFIEVARIISSQFSDVKFLIAGDILNPKDVKYKDFLENLIISYDLQTKINFTGFVNDIPDFLQQIDILCHTALNEPFGRVIIEAMSCEKPVIAYNSGGIKEIITSNTGVLIPENNIGVFAEELNKLINDKHRRQKIGKEARKRVKKKFEINQYITQMEGVFINV